MCFGIGSGRGTDISALDIADDDQAFLPAVSDRPVINSQSRKAELFVHRDLRFDSGNYVINGVHDSLIELPDRLGSSHKIRIPGGIRGIRYTAGLLARLFL